MQRALFAASVLGIATVAVASLPRAAAAQRTQIIPPGQNATATLSPGIKYGDIIYASGQLGTSRTQPDSTIQGQTKKALENVKAVVEAGGSNMENVLQCTVFLVDLKDFAGMNAAYSAAFPKQPPARSTVVVAALVSPSAKLEVECIAAVPK
ncbi:MAG TPA: RidA family protein [Gemmatimonadaceae bacterium]|nr:RidA family protein [Gemmatimonadaceae bacterium]